MKTTKQSDKLHFMFPFLLILFLAHPFSAGAQCEIGQVNATPTECNDLGYFNVIIDFDYANVGDEGFSVQGNGVVYGNYTYDELPVTIYELEGDGVTVYEFVVRDIQYPDCSNWTAIDPVDCDGGTGGECDISNLVVDDHPCIEEVFYCYVNFDFNNASNEGFSLHINGVHYGNFSYNDLPLQEVGPLAGDGTTIYHFLVRDLVYESCAEDLNFGPIDCGAGQQCNIWNINAAVLPCDESGSFNVLIDFEYINIGFDGFRIQGNGNNYGNYEYDDIPVLIGPLEGDGITEYEFVVIDNEFEDCSDWTAIDPVDCDGSTGDCQIGDIESTILPCNDENEFYVLLDFEYTNTSDGFIVNGNGVNYGTFLYADLPIEVGPLIGDGVTIYEFGVNDAVHDNCGNDTFIEPVSCDGETAFLNFSTLVIECENEQYELLIDFDVVHAGDEGFLLSGNDTTYGSFEYQDLPLSIGPLQTDGLTAYHFIARDITNTHFGNYDRLIPFTCESLGIENNMDQESGIIVYPNPSSGKVTFENIGNEDLRVIIYNSSGTEVKAFTLNKKHHLNILDKGIYFYRLTGKNNPNATGKIIIID